MSQMSAQENEWSFSLDGLNFVFFFFFSLLALFGFGGSSQRLCQPLDVKMLHQTPSYLGQMTPKINSHDTPLQ
jgi:hypothetical protein